MFIALLGVAVWACALTQVLAANDSIVSWYGARGAVFQDVAVIEGGWLYRQFSNGTQYTQPPNQLLFNIDLCDTFTVTTNDNLVELLTIVDEDVGPGDPFYVGGGMFVNDYEWYTFGGLPYATAKDALASSIIQFNQLDIDDRPAGWQYGPTAIKSPTGINSNIVNGAWCSNPAAKKAWWLGGMQAQNEGAIWFIAAPNSTKSPDTPSSVFLEVDMTDAQSATFSNVTGQPPNWVVPRAEHGMVWLPYGKEGILLVIGGASSPADLYSSGVRTDGTNDINMTTIPIYDIASGNWYLQETLERAASPPATAEFCSVVATAQDGSGYFIYVYGGYDGTYESANSGVYDTVWVLAVPAMQWVLVSQAQNGHGRQSQVCYKAGSQMVSVGGVTANAGDLDDSWVDVFDLNGLSWTHTYNPNWTEYEVSTTITQQIGVGNSKGGFSSTLPSELNPSVRSLFSTVYPTAIPVQTLNCSSSPPKPTIIHIPTPNKWKIPVIAVCSVIGALVIGATVWFLCFRRRRGSTEATGANSRNIFNWRQGVVGASTNKSVVSEETTVTPVGDYFGPHKTGARETINESYELHNTGSPAPAYYSPPPLVSPGSPQSATSYGNTRSSAHEVEASSARHGWSNHPAHPPSHIDGDFIIAGTASVSGQSGHASHYRTVGQMSPYEMAHDRSEERLAQPDDVDLNDTRTDQFEASSAKMPMIARKPVSRAATPMQSPTGHRPTHNRHNSSLSSGIPDLPSPSNTESKRQSHMIESLPDSSPRSGPLRSPFREHFDEQRQPLRRGGN